MVQIDCSKWGRVIVDGKNYFSDLYVYWDGRAEPRKKSHLFDLDELVGLLKKNPSIIIIGLGHNGTVKIPDEVIQLAQDKKVELYMETSPKAGEVFNAFAGDGKKAIAVIHTTC